MDLEVHLLVSSDEKPNPYAYYPGETMSVHVLVCSPVLVYLDKLRFTFRALQSCSLQDAFDSYSTEMEHPPPQSVEHTIREGFINAHADYSVKVEFDIPSDAPPSYRGWAMILMYEIVFEACDAYGNVAKELAWPVKVLPLPGPDWFLGPVFESNTSMFPGGPFTLSASLKNTMIGYCDPLHLVVSLDNQTYHRVRHLRLNLQQQGTFVTTDYATDHSRLLASCVITEEGIWRAQSAASAMDAMGFGKTPEVSKIEEGEYFLQRRQGAKSKAMDSHIVDFQEDIQDEEKIAYKAIADGEQGGIFARSKNQIVGHDFHKQEVEIWREGRQKLYKQYRRVTGRPGFNVPPHHRSNSISDFEGILTKNYRRVKNENAGAKKGRKRPDDHKSKSKSEGTAAEDSGSVSGPSAIVRAYAKPMTDVFVEKMSVYEKYMVSMGKYLDLTELFRGADLRPMADPGVRRELKLDVLIPKKVLRRATELLPKSALGEVSLCLEIEVSLAPFDDSDDDDAHVDSSTDWGGGDGESVIREVRAVTERPSATNASHRDKVCDQSSAPEDGTCGASATARTEGTCATITNLTNQSLEGSRWRMTRGKRKKKKNKKLNGHDIAVNPSVRLPIFLAHPEGTCLSEETTKELGIVGKAFNQCARYTFDPTHARVFGRIQISAIETDDADVEASGQYFTDSNVPRLPVIVLESTLDETTAPDADSALLNKTSLCVIS